MRELLLEIKPFVRSKDDHGQRVIVRHERDVGDGELVGDEVVLLAEDALKDAEHATDFNLEAIDCGGEVFGV